MAQNINVDVTPNLFQPTLYYHQGDIGRAFTITISTKDGYTIPSGATVKIEATKPSGLGFSVSGTLSGNVVSFVSTEGMTDEYGRFPAQLKITSGNDILYTANFLMVGAINTHPASVTDGTAEQVISEITLLVERAETAASTAATDAANAAQARVDEMMDYLPSEVANLKSDLSALFDDRLLTPLTEKSSEFIKLTGILTSWKSGNQNFISANGSYNTYYFVAKEDFTLQVPDYYLPNAYISIGEWTNCTFDLDNNSISGANVFYYRRRYSGGSMQDDIPHGTNITVHKGNMFGVTVMSAGDIFSLLSDYREQPKIETTNVISKDDLYCLYKPKSAASAYGSLYMFTRHESGAYSCLEYSHSYNNANNCDTWRIQNLYKASISSGEFVLGDKIVLDGEWECAIKIHGASDFIGGYAHGDEVDTSALIYLDGKLITFGQEPYDQEQVFICKKVSAIVASDLNVVDTPSTPFAKHIKAYDFTAGKVSFRQSVKFLGVWNLDFSYLTMLPVARDFTSYMNLIGETEIIDISSTSFTQKYRHMKKVDLTMYGSGFSMRLMSECDSTDPVIYVSNSSSPAYNKVYYTFVGGDGMTTANNQVVSCSSVLEYEVG